MRDVPRGIPILCYHDVSNVRIPAFRSYILPERRFAAQMRWIQRLGFEPIGLDALHDYLHKGGPVPRRAVVITFDDGYKELARTATPLLSAMGYPHTHFVNTARLGGTTAWVDEAPNVEIAGAEEIRDMLNRHGRFVDFQAHGHTHDSFAKLTPEGVRREVIQCVEELSRITGRPVSYLAYPYGDYGPETLETMASLPLRCSFTVDTGLCRPGMPWHALPRVEIFTTDTTADFLLKLFFGRSPFAALRRYPFRRKIRSRLAR